MSKCGHRAHERYNMIKNFFASAVFEIQVKTTIFRNFKNFLRAKIRKNARTMVRIVSKRGRQSYEDYDIIKNFIAQALLEIQVKTTVFRNFKNFLRQKWEKIPARWWGWYRNVGIEHTKTMI